MSFDPVGAVRVDSNVPSQVLVADNDEGVLELLRAVFRKYALRIDLCPDGLTAWENLCKNKYRVFVCDLNMPGRSGVELIEMMGALPHVPEVIVISGYLDDDTIRHLSARPHVVSVYRKPFDVMAFGDEVRRRAGGEDTTMEVEQAAN